MDLPGEIRSYWDLDATTYDRSDSHNPTSPEVQAAWRRSIGELLPPAPARVVDFGAGTGFLSLNAAALGYQVTAVDVAPAMLAQLRSKAADANLTVETVESDATNPPIGPFDVVIERHLLWTLPDPVRALAAWRAVAPDGVLVLFEGTWGKGSTRLDRARSAAHKRLDGLRHVPPDHHAPYPEALREALPLGQGASTTDLAAAAQSAGWRNPEVKRLRDLEVAIARGSSLTDRLLGARRWHAIVAS